MARQWPAAYELSRMMDDPKVRGDKQLRSGAGARRSTRRKTTTRGFANTSRWPSAGSIRRCRARRSTSSSSRSLTPINRGRRRLVANQRLDRRDERSAHQHHLGAGCRRATRASCPRCSRFTYVAGCGHPQDGGLRLGALAGRRRRSRRCRPRSRIGTPDVRWNAAVGAGAARQPRRRAGASGRCSIATYVEHAVTRDVRAGRATRIRWRTS